MKTIRKFSFVRALLLMVAALSLSTSLAAAQSVERGSFELPSEAHWGGAVLPAGAYTFSVESMSTFPLVMVRSADGKIAGMFMAQSVSRGTGSELLILTRRGEEMYVSSLHLSEAGLTLQYKLPRSAEGPALAGLTAP